MTDNRFKDFPIDARFPSPGVDFRFAELGVDARFRDGLDTRFQGDTYGAFNPRTLFGPTDTGWIYDLSDMSTLFQEAAGITPVTAVNQPVGLCLDKSGRGNHRSQSASLPRPTYARHPLSGIRNLLTASETETQNALGISAADGVVTVGNGAIPVKEFTPTGGTGIIGPGKDYPNAVGVDVTLSVYVLPKGNRYIYFSSNSFGVQANVGVKLRYDTQTQSMFTRFTANLQAGSAKVQDLGGGLFRCVISIRPNAATGNKVFSVFCSNELSNAGLSDTVLSFTDPPISPFSYGGWQAENLGDAALNPNPTPYQRVVSAFDVTEAGVPDLYYLSYDGLNDSLSTAPFAWGSDKATVVAGVRKLSNALAVICETSANFNSNNGSFAVLSGNNAGSVYSSAIKGTATSSAAIVTQGVAPDAAVITHIGDISGDFVRLRRNTIIGRDSQSDVGTGNFGIYPVFFGARAGTSLFFNGREYSQFAINRLLTPNELSQIERYTGQRTGITIASPFKAYALGDSTVAAFAGGTALMQLFDTGYTEIDLSVPGHTIAQQKTAWVNQTIVADETAWVIMQIGLNDLVPAEAASVAIARLQDLADTIKSEIGSKPLLIAQMIPCRQRLINLYGATNGPIAYQKWLDMNAAIAGLGPTPITGVQGRITEHVPLMDDGNGNLRAEFDTGDGIHPNNAGRQVNVTAWRNALGVLGL